MDFLDHGPEQRRGRGQVPELVTFKVPLTRTHSAASNGRMPGPETVRRRAGTPAQARDRAIIIRMESA